MRHSFPARWKKHKLDELGFVGRGKSRHRPRNEPSLYGGEYPFFKQATLKQRISIFPSIHRPITKKAWSKASYGNPEHFVLPLLQTLQIRPFWAFEVAFPIALLVS